MIPHHVGCAVASIEQGLATYRALLPDARRSRVFDIASQSVQVCFVELAPESYVELVCGGPADRFVKQGFYHLCFTVDDLDAYVAGLDRSRFRALPAFTSEAFDGHRCQFVATPELHLIELAEITRAEFRTFFERSLT